MGLWRVGFCSSWPRHALLRYLGVHDPSRLHTTYKAIFTNALSNLSGVLSQKRNEIPALFTIWLLNTFYCLLNPKYWFTQKSVHLRSFFLNNRRVVRISLMYNPFPQILIEGGEFENIKI